MKDSAWIVFLHGLESSSKARKAVFLTRLFKARVVVPDWRVSARMAECVAFVVDCLPSDSQGCILVGSSMGGYVAAHVACRITDRLAGLIYVNPVVAHHPHLDRHFVDLHPFDVPLHDVPTSLLLGMADHVCPPELAARHFSGQAKVVWANDDHGFSRNVDLIAREIQNMDRLLHGSSNES